jgi:hypothetical protein
VQLTSDLHARVAQRNQPQDLNLTHAQLVLRDGPVNLVQPECQVGAHIPLAASGEANRLGQLLIGEILPHEADCSGGQRTLSEHGVLLHRHDHDLRLRRPLAQPSDRFAARTVRHTQVKHQHVRPVPSDMSKDRRQVTGFGDDLDVILAFEQHAQRATHERVVIGKDHADCVPGGRDPRVGGPREGGRQA